MSTLLFEAPQHIYVEHNYVLQVTFTLQIQFTKTTRAHMAVETDAVFII
jgi:hypothetical protein